jgi:hypothetical protein
MRDGVGEKPCEGEEGSKREEEANPRGQRKRERVGSNETSISIMVKKAI